MSDNTITIATTRLSPETVERLKAAARANDRSVASELRRLVTATYNPASEQVTAQAR